MCAFHENPSVYTLNSHLLTLKAHNHKMYSDSFTIFGLWVPGFAVSHINESQLQTYESRSLFFMICLKCHCHLGLAEIKTFDIDHPREKIMRKRCRMCR